MNEGKTLADRLREFTRPVEQYVTVGEVDPVLTKTAKEIEGGMMYLGMEDAMLQLALEVQDLEERAAGQTPLLGRLVRMPEIGAQVEVEGGHGYVLWRCPDCKTQLLAHWDDEDQSRIRYQQFCPHPFDEPEMIVIPAEKL